MSLHELTQHNVVTECAALEVRTEDRGNPLPTTAKEHVLMDRAITARLQRAVAKSYELMSEHAFSFPHASSKIKKVVTTFVGAPERMIDDNSHHRASSRYLHLM